MIKPSINNSTLHYVILSCIVQNGFAPTIEELCKHFSSSRKEIVDGLAALAEYHGLVLHPENSEVWVIHPFSLAPTNYWLENSKGSWWANCTWCALGAASLLESDITITTTLGAESKQVQIRIVDGQLVDRDFVVHFPIPMTQAWANVIFTCSVMCLFESEAQVNDWCRRHNLSKGDVQPIEKIWLFARSWYQNHMSPTWKKWTTEEATSLFNQFELKGRIWELPPSDGRF